MTTLAPSPEANVLNEIGRRRRRERRVECIGFELDDEAGAFLRDRVRRLRRDVEREPHQRAQRFEAPGDAGHPDVCRGGSIATACATRSACRARAREHVERNRRARTRTRPSRAGGAGSEIRRPPTEARLWPGVSTIDCVRAVTVRPPARLSSRTVSSKSFVEVVEREHLLAIDEPGGKGAPAFGGQNGVGGRCGRRLRPDRSKREQQRACS